MPVPVRNEREGRKALKAGKKKIYEVIKANTNDNFLGIETSRGQHLFEKHGRVIIQDEGEAREIDQTYGLDGGTKDVTVTRVDVKEHGHTYHFRISICNEPGCAQKPVRKQDYCPDHIGGKDGIQPE